MFLNPAEAWRLLLICAGIVAGFLLYAHLSKIKQKVPLFYCWLGAIAVLGGAAAFFLPIAVNSGFNKDDDGSALRQALLYTTGGLLGVITLGETHRKNNQEKEKNENDHTRQVYAERRSRYTKAVEQLANEKATVRLGGIYTLVGLVDEWLADDSLAKDKQQEEGQVIINNLCSYIRSPFPLAEKIEEYEARKELEKLQKSESEKLSEEASSRLQILLKRFKNSDEYEEPKDITADYAKFHEEQDVRRTIFVEMSKRSSILTEDEKDGLFKANPETWSRFQFDFSRAPVFYPLNNLKVEKGNFSSAKFYNGAGFKSTIFLQTADFKSATFAQKADFKLAVFVPTADFMRATFTQTANFNGAIFNDGAIFSWATFAQTADFRSAVFTQSTFFSWAIFTQTADFVRATFTQTADFMRTTFAQTANFRSATFISNVDFTRATFKRFEPTFATKLGNARFSAQKDQQDYVFSVSRGSKPINCGTATLDGKRFKIPLGAALFDPDSWDEETKTYTRVSKPAKPLENSDTKEEKPTE